MRVSSISIKVLLVTLSLFQCNLVLSFETPIAEQRIIALSPHSVELLYAIGAGERIIGTLEYADYPKAALEIPRIGNFNGIQIEKVVKLQPDLIVAWKSGNKSSDLEKLKSLGFNIYHSQPQSIDEIRDELIELGKLTGQNNQAKIAADEMMAQYQTIKNRYKSKSSVNVFYQLWHDPIRTIGPDNWTQSLINDCNASNIFNDAASQYPVVSLESILVKNPEVIVIPHHSGSKDAKRAFWQKWSDIKAVKNEHINIINGDLLHRFSPRAIDGLSILCEAIDKARSS
ncbi:MAG: vitamin B12 transport system substrate-binding protein [Enterobacterales bacterium]|jgi:vitamin B12 transport system substrate-binding protein